jgi:hypothetical protein
MLEERENGMLRQLSMYFLQLQEQIYQNHWKADSFANHEECLFVKDLFPEREYIRQIYFIRQIKEELHLLQFLLVTSDTFKDRLTVPTSEIRFLQGSLYWISSDGQASDD